MSALLPEVQTHSVNGTTYFMFVPPGVDSSTPILVSVHGISRNAEDHVNFYVPYARQKKVIVVSPLLDEATYPDYQTLEQNSDKALISIFSDAKARTGTQVNMFHLSGSSGGAQFAHRFMMRYPEMIRCLAVNAAGWYTFPQPNTIYWKGIRYSSEVGLMDPNKFLLVPTMASCGTLDNQDALTSEYAGWQDYANGEPYTDDINIHQGIGRFERARRWIEAMRAEATARGFLSTPYQFLPIEGMGHDFGAKDMCGRIMDWHFPTATVNYGPNLIVNGNFEAGNLSGWYDWRPANQSSKQRVEEYDAFEGRFQCNFYSSRAYEQAIHQVINNLEPGKYEVSAFVKLDKPADIARLEVYDHQPQIPWVFVNIDPNGIYHKVSTTVDVTSGKIGVGLYVKSAGGAKLKIDKVEVRKVL